MSRAPRNRLGEILCASCGSNRPRLNSSMCGTCLENDRQQAIQADAHSAFIANIYDVGDEATRACLSALFTMMTGEEP